MQEVNVRGYYAAVQAVYPHFLRQKSGRIVGVGGDADKLLFFQVLLPLGHVSGVTTNLLSIFPRKDFVCYWKSWNECLDYGILLTLFVMA